MPDAVVYYAVATFGVGIVTEVVAAVLLLVAAGRGTAAGLRRLAGHPVDSAVTAPCDSSDCRGLPTVHHATATGLRCAECGQYADAV
ncbi:hypothetical protein [Streptomyces sp. NPDC057428]|uniref:hypothetical protein n=1 Tax=Streptomyces sp. NPDC057428 TaxID=3346129 RepID=UPI0036B5922D